MNLTNAYVLWFVLGLGLVVTDLFLGTFFLLVVAIGFGAAGLVSLAGGDLVLQLVIGAAVGLAGTLTLRKMRWAKRGKRGESSSNPDLVLDIGQVVQVKQWENGTARVHYRGADWDAVLDSAAATSYPGSYHIKAIRGSTLVLAQRPASAHARPEDTDTTS